MATLSTPVPGSASAGMDMFLRLLTAQLKNQDPLSPMEGTEFAQQLATFSNVEQQIKTVEKLDRISESLAGSRFHDAAAMVGRDVNVAVTSFDYAGTPIDLHANLPEGAAVGRLLIKDRSGSSSVELPVTKSGSLQWDGRLKDGTAAPSGSYDVSLHSLLDDGSAGPAGEVRMDRRISAVAFEDDALKLLGPNGLAIDAATIRQFK
jgi:flagellar basal-body rod modification protein FlgD